MRYMPTFRRRNTGEWHGGLLKLIAIVVVIFLLIGPGIRCAQQLPELAGQAAGQIFAGIGKGLGVVSDAVFSAVVIMVMVTTLLTPPLLKITLARSRPAA